jgi:hypothetical protein
VVVDVLVVIGPWVDRPHEHLQDIALVIVRLTVNDVPTSVSEVTTKWNGNPTFPLFPGWAAYLKLAANELLPDHARTV